MFEIFLGQTGGMSKPERLVGLLGILLVCCYGVWALVRWLLSAPSQPDPWDKETARKLAEGDCIPLCHHCLAPHDPMADFCPQCGAAVGLCTNLLPFPYLFSIGHALRIGTGEHFKRSGLTIGGFIVFSLAEYGPFAPLYWFRFVRNLRQASFPVTPDPTDPTHACNSSAPPGQPR